MTFAMLCSRGGKSADEIASILFELSVYLTDLRHSGRILSHALSRQWRLTVTGAAFLSLS